LARAGHSVVVVDPDPAMLAAAAERLTGEDDDVADRVTLVPGLGEDAVRLVGDGFDAACCHSVLMYAEDPRPLLHTLVDLVRPGGPISVLSVNPDAVAMRAGLRREWAAAVAHLSGVAPVDGQYVLGAAHSLEAFSDTLRDAGATPLDWFGVGVFTDHWSGTVSVDDPATVLLAEWLAGRTDPYRLVARCFHLLAVREGTARSAEEDGDPSSAAAVTPTRERRRRPARSATPRR
jgi:S-adenosylmethionine-dependent methyltransferase